MARYRKINGQWYDTTPEEAGNPYGTKAEFEAIKDTLPTGAAFDTTDEDAEGGAAYSTEEQVVGTWIDGKPVYEKTIIGNTPNKTNTSTQVATIASNIKQVIYFDGSIEFASNSFTKLTHVYSTTTHVATLIQNNNIMMGVFNEGFLNKPFIATVRYTKTTD